MERERARDEKERKRKRGREREEEKERKREEDIGMLTWNSRASCWGPNGGWETTSRLALLLRTPANLLTTIACRSSSDSLEGSVAFRFCLETRVKHGDIVGNIFVEQQEQTNRTAGIAAASGV